VVQGLRDAVSRSGKNLLHAYDAVSEKGSYQNVCQVLHPNGGKITLVLPGRKYEEIPATVEKSITSVGSVHGVDKDFGHVFCRLIAKGLVSGWFKAHPQEVVPGGLAGVEKGLSNLKEGKASAVKYVFRIGDTEGVVVEIGAGSGDGNGRAKKVLVCRTDEQLEMARGCMAEAEQFSKS